MRKALSLTPIVMLALSGCMNTTVKLPSLTDTLSTRGEIKESYSEVDNKKILVMDPALTDLQTKSTGSVGTAFGLVWDASMKDSAILVLEIEGSYSPSRKDSLTFVADGKRFTLQPAAGAQHQKINENYDKYGLTNLKPFKSNKISTTQYRNYIISRKQIDAIAKASKAAFKLIYVGGSALEKSIDYSMKDNGAYVPMAFKEFSARVWRSPS